MSDASRPNPRPRALLTADALLRSLILSLMDSADRLAQQLRRAAGK